MISDARTATCDDCGERKAAAGDGLPQGWVTVDVYPVLNGHRHKGHGCSVGCATRLTVILYTNPHVDCLDCRREHAPRPTVASPTT